MKGIWCGDRRDRVKWGGLIHLARSFKISRIVHVSYFREVGLPGLIVDGVPVPLPQEVWDHFSSLSNITALAAKVAIEISAVGCIFEHARRSEYREEVLKELQATRDPLIAFCDPDTGIAAGRPQGEHATTEELQDYWAVLKAGDILAVYQHAHRTGDWAEAQRELMSQAIGGDVRAISGPDIARDVALLWCRK